MARNCMPSLLIPDALWRFSRFITVHASIEMYGVWHSFDHCHSGKDAHDKEKELYDEEDHKVYLCR